jgi:hypothetical protein
MRICLCSCKYQTRTAAFMRVAIALCSCLDKSLHSSSSIRCRELEPTLLPRARVLVTASDEPPPICVPRGQTPHSCHWQLEALLKQLLVSALSILPHRGECTCKNHREKMLRKLPKTAAPSRSARCFFQVCLPSRLTRYFHPAVMPGDLARWLCPVIWPGDLAR